MLSSQRIVNDFKHEFGNLSYREISMMTGIQMTRVFRIFNQQEMKVSEYERFKTLLLHKKKGAAKVMELFNQHLPFLRPGFIGKMEMYLEREIKISKLVKLGGK